MSGPAHSTCVTETRPTRSRDRQLKWIAFEGEATAWMTLNIFGESTKRPPARRDHSASQGPPVNYS